MNGVITDLWLRIIKPPNKTKTIIIGRSQYFFPSFKNDIFKIVFSLYYIGEAILPKKITNLNHILFSGVNNLELKTLKIKKLLMKLMATT
jgi:hypothetical protein